MRIEVCLLCIQLYVRYKYIIIRVLSSCDIDKRPSDRIIFEYKKKICKPVEQRLTYKTLKKNMNFKIFDVALIL